jgi:hypothetical protein
MKASPINLKAKLNTLNNKTVYLCKIITGNGPEQFVDESDNIWYMSELTNIEHFKTIKNY